LFAPGIAAFAIALPIAPAAAAAAPAAPVVAARFAVLAHLAVRLVLRAIAFGNVSSVTVLVSVGLRPKFPARFDHGVACGDILICRGQIAGLPDRDALDAV
jgi:hypothetical protein